MQKNKERKMGETVYVDLLFLINFSMDFLCFYITAKILSEKLSLPRALIASVLGGIYSDIVLFVDVRRILALVIDITVCVMICVIAFYKRKKMRQMPMHVLVYLAVSMALGGFMTAIFNLLNRADIPMSESHGGGISLASFALLAGVSAAITLIGGRFFKGKSTQRISEVRININGRYKTLQGMADSGNLLCEPISGCPCIVCDANALREILPKGVYEAAISTIDKLDVSDCKGIRLVPAKTASGGRMLVAIRPKEIIICTEKGEKEVDAYVALGDVGRGADGCDALVPTTLVI